ncbi:Uncharacterized protein QTN25_007550 [Entamoeba marina]
MVEESLEQNMPDFLNVDSIDNPYKAATMNSLNIREIHTSILYETDIKELQQHYCPVTIETCKNINGIIFPFETLLREIMNKMEFFKQTDCTYLLNTIIETFRIIYENSKNIYSNPSYKETTILSDSIRLIEYVRYFPIVDSFFDSKFQQLRLNFNALMPKVNDNSFSNQEELRQYLGENGINTTKILIQLCDPNDITDYMKGIESLLILFNKRNHSKKNYVEMIHDLNDTLNNTLIATPFFLLKKAMECAVIKQQFAELLKVLSRAINDNFFNNEQKKEVNSMLDNCFTKSKSSPEKFGPRCKPKRDKEIFNYQYVKDYMKKSLVVQLLCN